MLTAKQIDALATKDKSYRVTDSRGLALRVDPTGAKYWIATVTKQGKRTTVSLGRWPEVSAIEARRKYSESQSKKAKTESGMTFCELTEKWHSVKESKLSSSKYAAQILRRVEVDVFPDIGNTDIAGLTRRELIAVVQKVADRGAVETAHRLSQYIGRILDYAVDCGYIDQHPGNNLGRILPAADETHHASLAPSDSGPLFAAMWSYRHDAVIAGALRLLALTAVRSSELAGARWEEVQEDVWIIPAERMKRKKLPHVVPLSFQAKAEFDRLRGMTSEYVFQSGRKFIHPETPAMAIRRLGFAGVQTAHGLRSIFSTAANESGLFSKDAIERQLSHKESDEVRAAYHRAEHLAERRRLMQWWADWIDASRKS